MVLLARPHARFHQSWLAAADEFAAAGDDQHGGVMSWPADETFAGVEFTRDGLVDPAEFDRFVQNRLDDDEPDSPRPAGWVPCSFFWLEDPDVADEFVGSIALRHNIDNPFLAEFGGHVGYSVRPSARRRGYAVDALRQVVAVAGGRGIERILVTCDEDNLASARTAQAAGGTYEDTRDGKRRYWIPTGA